MREFDVVIIGSGTAGQTAAYALAPYGLSLAVVEHSSTPGGICALAGCQAKKWFYEAAETVAKSRHRMGKGFPAPARADWAQVLAQKNAFTAKIPDRTVKGLKAEGIAFMPGRARFLDSTTIEVAGEPIRARHVIVATGAKPMDLPIAGAQHMIDSTAFLDLPDLPANIVLIGGGFISFEFAHFAARLGPESRRITILEAASRPLGPFDAEMVAKLIEASAEEGIDIRTGVTIKAIEKTDRGFQVVTDSGGIAADIVVHGAGRVAAIDDLGLETTGIAFNRRGIGVDGTMRTTNPAVFAIGDCAATIQLARVADYEGQIAARNIVAAMRGGQPLAVDYAAVPAILFTYPQLGMIGKTEEALKQEGIAYEKSAGANLTWPSYRRIGMKHAAYKILVGRDGLILGAHFLSDNTAGMLNTIRHAMINRIRVQDIHRQNIMAPYPTRESDLIYMLDAFLPEDYLLNWQAGATQAGKI